MPPPSFRRQVEVAIAARLPGVAFRLPCMKGHREALETMLRGTARMIRRAVECVGEEFLEIVRRENEQLGVEIGRMMRERYGLSSDLDGAVRLIQLQVIPFDIDMRVIDQGERRVVLEKFACPMWDALRTEGVDPCDLFCVPATLGAVRVLDPTLNVSLSRRPDEERYCVKVVEKIT